MISLNTFYSVLSKQYNITMATHCRVFGFAILPFCQAVVFYRVIHKMSLPSTVCLIPCEYSISLTGLCFRYKLKLPLGCEIQLTVECIM